MRRVLSINLIIALCINLVAPAIQCGKKQKFHRNKNNNYMRYTHDKKSLKSKKFINNTKKFIKRKNNKQEKYAEILKFKNLIIKKQKKILQQYQYSSMQRLKFFSVIFLLFTLFTPTYSECTPGIYKIYLEHDNVITRVTAQCYCRYNRDWHCNIKAWEDYFQCYDDQYDITIYNKNEIVEKGKTNCHCISRELVCKSNAQDEVSISISGLMQKNSQPLLEKYNGHLPSWLKPKNAKIIEKMSDCNSKIKISRIYQGIYWLQECTVRVFKIFKDEIIPLTEVIPVLVGKYIATLDPDYCPSPKVQKLPSFIRNCRNGTKVCSLVHCQECYKNHPELKICPDEMFESKSPDNNIEFSQAGSSTNTIGSCDSIAQELRTLNQNLVLIITPAISFSILAITLPKLIGCLIKMNKKSKKKKYKKITNRSTGEPIIERVSQSDDSQTYKISFEIEKPITLV